jgi:DNA-binding transcriptional LysR family regulator
MDLRQLRYFVAVAEELSFTAAARRLNISQPPLSMQVMALEAAIGVQLIDRTHRSISLTDAGKVFLEQARQTLSQMAHGVEMTQRAGRGEAGLLRVAFTGSVPLVPGFATLIKAFRREWPLARLQIEHMPTGTQLQALEQGRIDVGMLRPSPHFRPPEHLVLTEFWKDALCVVLPEGHALAGSRQPIAVKAVAAQPLILFPRGIGCGLHDHVMTLCNQVGFVPQVVYEAREGTTIVGLVAAGVGISLLPTAYGQLGTGGVCFAPLDPVGPETISRSPGSTGCRAWRAGSPRWRA